VDRVHSLQIATLGLATGVHVNGQGGSSTLCRFPVNTSMRERTQVGPYRPSLCYCTIHTYESDPTRV
jgi:hypothetical protein